MQYNVMNPNWYWDLPTLPAGVVDISKANGTDDPNWSTANVAKVNAQQQTYANLFLDLYQPDILALNERFAEWNTFTANLTAKKGYAIVGTVPSGHTTNCNPILYKTSKFSLVKSGVYDFSTTSIANTDNDTSGIRVMTWAILQSKTSGKKIAVFNMHLQAGGIDDTNNTYRKNQAIAVASQIKSILTQNAVSNVILTGDMNSLHNGTRNDSEAAIGSAYDELLSKLSGTTGITHAYTSSDTQIDHFAYIGCTINQKGTDISNWTNYVSDHCPIYMDITLK